MLMKLDELCLTKFENKTMTASKCLTLLKHESQGSQERGQQNNIISIGETSCKSPPHVPTADFLRSSRRVFGLEKI